MHIFKGNITPKMTQQFKCSSDYKENSLKKKCSKHETDVVWTEDTLTLCKVQISLSFFYNPALSSSKSFLTVFTAFTQDSLSPFSRRDKVMIFSKIKSNHSILLLKTPFQWLHMASIIYLHYLPWPIRSHLISSLALSSISHRFTSFNSIGLMSVSPTK